MQISFLKKINNKKGNKSNQTKVVKHCQAFQISVAHQKDLESTQPPAHTIQNQTDQKVKQGHLFTEIRTKKSCRDFMAQVFYICLSMLGSANYFMFAFVSFLKKAQMLKVYTILIKSRYAFK